MICGKFQDWFIDIRPGKPQFEDILKKTEVKRTLDSKECGTNFHRNHLHTYAKILQKRVKFFFLEILFPTCQKTYCLKVKSKSKNNGKKKTSYRQSIRLTIHSRTSKQYQEYLYI